MTRRTSRPLVALLALLTLLVVAAAAGAGCSSTLRDAATIRFDNGDGDEEVVHIRRDDFEDQLRELAASDAIMQSLAENGVEARPESSTVDSDLAALWLTTLINSVAVQSEFDDRDVELTDAEREQAAAAYAGLEDLDQDLVDLLIDQQAAASALIASFASEVEDPPQPSDEELRAIYDQNVAAIATCTSGEEVSHILVEDQATADAIAGELAAGASFADLARERSTDTASGAQGGSLGCLGSQPFVEEFQQAADGAPLDEIVGPVQSEFGFHLILVTQWNPTFEKFRDQLAQQVTSQAQQSVEQQRTQLFNEALTARLEAMDVDVDPRFGTWEDSEGAFRVVAPTAPSARNQREPQATTTTLPLAGIGG